MSISNELHNGIIHLFRNGVFIKEVPFWVLDDGIITTDGKYECIGDFDDWGSFLIYLNDYYQAEIRIVAVND